MNFMFSVEILEKGIGITIKLENSTLLIIKAKKGILGCGFISLETAEKFGEALAVVTGVSSIEEMLEKPVVGVSSKAKKLGVKEGMKGREALAQMS